MPLVAGAGESSCCCRSGPPSFFVEVGGGGGGCGGRLRTLPVREGHVLDGVGLVEALGRDGDETPVLFLSALGEIEDRVTGLRAGADDYLVKPYAFAELIARVEALSRRRETGSVLTQLRVGDLEMDLIARRVHRAGQEIDLQPREFQLLEFLMRHAGQAVTRTMLLEKVWEYHFDPQTNVIDVHISRLRSKIDKGFEHPMLETIRGAGYRLDA